MEIFQLGKKIKSKHRIFQPDVLVTGKATELASNASAGNSRVNIYVIQGRARKRDEEIYRSANCISYV